MSDSGLEPGTVVAQSLTQSWVKDLPKFSGTLGRRNVCQDAIRRGREEGPESIKTHGHI